MLHRAPQSQPSPWGSEIRRLTRQDLPQVTEHFLRLEPEALWGRFGRKLAERDILAYVQTLPIDRGVHAGCFAEGGLRGLIEARPVNDIAGHWECVVSVEADWRRKGLGLSLTDAAFRDARKFGASRVYMRCCTSNVAGQHFLARHTDTLREDDGEAVVAVDLVSSDQKGF